MVVPPVVRDWSAMGLATTGARLGIGCGVTVTTNVSVTERLPSLAVTVMVAVPAATPVRVKVVLLMATVALAVSLDKADRVRESPSGSLNTEARATVVVPPTVTDWSAMALSTVGA